MNEFELIEHYFARRQRSRADTPLGIGDDGAVLALTAGLALASTQVTLAGATDAPAELATRLVDRAIARLACTGATPRWATLAITLPSAGERWLGAFADALASRLAAHEVLLVGGDTTRGDFTATLGLLGSVAPPPRSRPTPRAGHRLWLADVGAAGALSLGQELRDRAALRACDGDVAETARRLAATHGLQATLEPSLPARVGDSALLVAADAAALTDGPATATLVAAGTLRPA